MNLISAAQIHDIVLVSDINQATTFKLKWSPNAFYESLARKSHKSVSTSTAYDIGGYVEALDGQSRSV